MERARERWKTTGARFARRFAAWRAFAGPDPWRVLFVPLHRFEVGTDLAKAVNEFAAKELQDSHLSLLPLPKGEQRVLLVFDGLDELAKQGKLGQNLADDFFRQLESLVRDANRDGCLDPRFFHHVRDRVDAHLVRGAGHFLQVEKPAEVNHLIAEFLA